MKIEQLERFRANFITMKAIKDGIMKDYEWLASLEKLNDNGQFTSVIKQYKEEWIESEITEMKQLSDELKQVTEAINGVKNHSYKRILEYRYIHGLPMGQIGRKLNTSDRTIWRSFNRAIQAIGIRKSGETDEQEHRSN